MAWWAWVLIIAGGVIGLLLFGLIALGIAIARAQKRDAPQSLEAAEAAYEAGDIRGALALLEQAYYVAFSDNYDGVTAKTNLGAVRLLEVILQERRRQNLDTPNLETAALRVKLEQAVRDGGGRVPTDLATEVERVLATAADTLSFDATGTRTRRRRRRSVLPDATPATTASATDTRSLAELEDAILQDPDSDDGFLVYSDWLQAHNDPRGMLIMLQHRAAQEPSNIDAKNEASGWMDRHRDRFVGDLARQGLELEWKLGFIRSARLTRPSISESHSAEELLEALLAHRSARFLYDLELGLLNHKYNWTEAIGVLVASGERRSLRRLFLGAFEYPDDCQMSWTSITGAEELWPRLPHLHTLIVQAGELGLGTLDLPQLEELEIRTGGLDAKTGHAVTGVSWPRLRKLHLWIGSFQFGSEVGIADLKPVFDGKGFRRLEELGLLNCEYTDEVCRALVSSNILPQLKVVDLSMGTMTDEGAGILLEHAEALAHLERIQLAQNCLSRDAVAELNRLNPQIVANDQKHPSERYVSVDE